MGRNEAQARAVRARSGAQRNARREPWPQRATRSDRKGAEFQAGGQDGARQREDGHAAGVVPEQSAGMPAAGAHAVGGEERNAQPERSVTARLSKRSRAARSLASARPCGPGRRERSDRSRRATNGSGIADPPPRHQAKRLPWLLRRLRRARHPAGRSGGPGLTSAGVDVNAVQRSGTERTTATARILSERRFVRATAPHTPPPGPTATHRTGATTERKEEADGVTAARRWRDVCRIREELLLLNWPITF